jgi:hypothetical protein
MSRAVGLPASLRADVVGHPLGGEKRVAESSLDLLLPGELTFELFHLVPQIGALAPDLLEARDDLREQVVCRPPLVAERTTPKLDVPDFDRRERHLAGALRRLAQKSFSAPAL